MSKFLETHKNLIIASGGFVNDIFVEDVGVVITKKSFITDDARAIFDLMNIDTNQQDSQQHAEFNSRITYLSFKDKKSNSEEYNHKMIHEYGHRSVYNDEHVTVLIAGCSIETMLEFIAHNEASVARLTSSKTKSQDQTLYRIQKRNVSEEFQTIQKEIVKRYISEVRSMIRPNCDVENEIANILNLGNKAVSFTITMSLKDWHKTFIGRISHHGVENEMIEILTKVLSSLTKEYPSFFNTEEEYFEMNNSKKYGA